MLSTSTSLFAQNDTVESPGRPLVGVSLSGGGAKGFAHLGALKVIEEAGVPIDFIGGTSMGAIMGGLYAIGYSVEDIIAIVRSQDWNKIMADEIPQYYVPADKKYFYRHYLATFPLVNNKIQIESGLYEGNLVNMLLTRYTAPVYHIRDYSELSIPFLCVAADVNNAEPVEMTSGVLHRSIRASMAIPFYFTPVIMDDKVLFDGGMINNFPVRNLKNKGADIVIGIDLNQPFELSENPSPIDILDKIITLSGKPEKEKAVAESDIYINPDLHGTGMMDFNKYDSIIAMGESETRKYFPVLKALADSLQAIDSFDVSRKIVKPMDSIYIHGVKVSDLDDDKAAYILSMFNMPFPCHVSFDEIEERLLKIISTEYYYDVWYEFINEEDKTFLVIHCKKKQKWTLSVGAHYDSNYGVGVLLNLTFRNFGNYFKGSDMMIDINISGNPYLRLIHFYRCSNRLKLGYDISTMGVSLNYYEGDVFSNYYYFQNNKMKLFGQWIPTYNQSIVIGIGGEYIGFEDYKYKLVNDFEKYPSNKYNFYANAFLNYSLNNLDSPSFEKKGWRTNILLEYLVPGSLILGDADAEDACLLLNARVGRSFMISEKNSFEVAAVLATKFGNATMPLCYEFFVGGQSRMLYLDNIIAFTGMHFVQRHVQHISFTSLDWRYNFYKMFYGSLKCDVGFMSDEYEKWFDPENIVVGVGLTVGAKTIIGPVELSLMRSNVSSGFVGFVNVGYYF